MLLNTANNNNTVISNVLGLQKNCIRWLQDLRFSFRRLRREGYVAQESASHDGLSDWLLGTSESLKRPTPVPTIGATYIPLDESRGLFQTPGGNSAVASYLTPPTSLASKGKELSNGSGTPPRSGAHKHHPKYFAF